ncbi:CAAX prenyl protease [Dermatophagoides farinae]|uniref:CAAX prenyl protease 2 n=1 Tax=Dermatophagoides farinae TaxID=6954 RepID=A0A922L2I6_DERFA|nr:CAAX prenyl protease 2-like [Dermatophagoides farinae]KAH7645462.1 prenyl protease-like protein 2 [Dermatophagoides farinae]KAH9497685.1 CAAX prenyl protease [Dermatophagoides farinae]
MMSSLLESNIIDNDENYETTTTWKQQSISLLFTIFLSILYPASLYVWRDSARIDRNDPMIIKRNFFSVTIISLISLQLLNLFRQFTRTLPPDSPLMADSTIIINYFIYKHYPNNWNLIADCVIKPMMFIMILFIGPIFCDLNLNNIRNYKIIMNRTSIYNMIQSSYNLSILKILRNLIVAPFTEEFLFRGILIAILSPFWSKLSCILISSTLFALMHTHSCLVRYFINDKYDSDDIIATIIQCIYTGFFGIIAAVHYLSYGHLVTPILLHFFCNLNGLPDFPRILENRFYFHLTIVGFTIWFYYFINLFITLL